MKLTDDDIRQYLRGRWQLEHPIDLQKKEKTERNDLLVEAIHYGIPMRQLSRMTGISYGGLELVRSFPKGLENTTNKW